VLAEKRLSIDGFLQFKEDTRDWTANARKELRIGWLMGNRLERLGSDSCVREMSTAFGVALILSLILESGKAFDFVCNYLNVGNSRRDCLLFQWSGRRSRATLSGCSIIIFVLSLD
jgi:hypothetical protein